MFQLKYFLNLSIVIPLLFSGYCYAGSQTDADINLNVNSTNSSDEESGFRVTGDCDVVFDEQTNKIKLVSKLVVDPESRSRCIIRVQSPNSAKRLQLVPLAIKGKVTKAPASIAISSILVGEDEPSSFSQTYTKPSTFDVTNDIPVTGYTTSGQNVFGINLTVSTRKGSLEITELEFVIK